MGLFQRLFFFSVLILGILLFTSCTKKCPQICSDGIDCTRDLCSEETNYQCIYEEIPDCHCGNRQCEEALFENKCTCQKDCGVCSGQVNENVEYRCVNDECLTAIKKSIEIVPVSKFNNYQVGNFKISVKLDYENPINTELTSLKVTTRLEDLQPQVKNLKISRFTLKDDRNTFIAERELDEDLDNVGDSFDATLSFNEYIYDEQRNKFGGINLLLDMYYEHDYVVGTSTQERRSDYVVSFGPVKFITAQAGPKD